MAHGVSSSYGAHIIWRLSSVAFGNGNLFAPKTVKHSYKESNGMATEFKRSRLRQNKNKIILS